MYLLSHLGGGGLLHICPMRLILPNCLVKAESKIIWAYETGEPIPDTIRAPTEAEEKEFLIRMINEINSVTGAGLSVDISTRREICMTQAELAADSIRMYIFVGRKTADMLYAAAEEKGLPAACVMLADKTPAAVERAVRRLEDLVKSQMRVSSQILIVYNLFDDEIYVDADGRQPSWSRNNTYHIRGRVELLGRREMTACIG